ncbi:hypothetical protein D9M69_527900 [compost metagenome]
MVTGRKSMLSPLLRSNSALNGPNSRCNSSIPTRSVTASFTLSAAAVVATPRSPSVSGSAHSIFRNIVISPDRLVGAAMLGRQYCILLTIYNVDN